jgi:hypothetical protein
MHCLIPASGYYEWQYTAAGKQPWYFTRADGAFRSRARVHRARQRSDLGRGSRTISSTNRKALKVSPRTKRNPVQSGGRDFSGLQLALVRGSSIRVTGGCRGDGEGHLDGPAQQLSPAGQRIICDAQHKLKLLVAPREPTAHASAIPRLSPLVPYSGVHYSRGEGGVGKPKKPLIILLLSEPR